LMEGDFIIFRLDAESNPFGIELCPLQGFVQPWTMTVYCPGFKWRKFHIRDQIINVLDTGSDFNLQDGDWVEIQPLMLEFHGVVRMGKVLRKLEIPYAELNNDATFDATNAREFKRERPN